MLASHGYESELGIPVMLARLEDMIFNGLPTEIAKDWPLRFTSAVNVGSDLSRVGWQFLFWLMIEQSNNEAFSEELRTIIRQIADVLVPLKDGTGTVDGEKAKAAEEAWSTAEVEEAAVSAAVAWAVEAAESESARTAATRAAEAWSTAAAAEAAAARSARAARLARAAEAWSTAAAAEAAAARSAGLAAAWFAEAWLAARPARAAEAVEEAAAARSARAAVMWSVEAGLAARSAEAAYVKMADKLIALIEECK